MKEALLLRPRDRGPELAVVSMRRGAWVPGSFEVPVALLSQTTSTAVLQEKHAKPQAKQGTHISVMCGSDLPGANNMRCRHT